MLLSLPMNSYRLAFDTLYHIITFTSPIIHIRPQLSHQQLVLMRQLSFEIFCEADGILRKTTQHFFDCIHFYIQRRLLFTEYFKLCISVPESADSIIKVLFELCVSYLVLYDKTVTVTRGSIEKRQRFGKVMISTFETERVLQRVVEYAI